MCSLVADMLTLKRRLLLCMAYAEMRDVGSSPGRAKIRIGREHVDRSFDWRTGRLRLLQRRSRRQAGELVHTLTHKLHAHLPKVRVRAVKFDSHNIFESRKPLRQET